MHLGRLVPCLMMVWSCAASPSGSVSAVRPGIDVLLSDSLHLVSGRRLGLLTNQTGVDFRGVGDLDRLLEAGAQVTAIFAPEHGYRGMLDQSLIEHGIDSATQTRIWSLYGDTRAPTGEMLEEVDVLVIDLQDIGARTYTYISTALLAMEAAAEHAVPVLVLDRPNPIGGVLVQGPLLDTAFSSFVGMLPVPLRHGMTFGELARMGNDVLGLGADLTVIPADGWSRTTWFDETGLPWIRPSPNMPDLESATHYPGTVLFEATNLSVGRGTPLAFQVIGAPWLNPWAVIGWVGAIDGATLSDTMVTPQNAPDGKYSGQNIPVIRLSVTDRERYDPVAASVGLLAAIRALHGDSLIIFAQALDQRAGDAFLRRSLEARRAAEEIARSWAVPLDQFRRGRTRYLIYR